MINNLKVRFMSYLYKSNKVWNNINSFKIFNVGELY